MSDGLRRRDTRRPARRSRWSRRWSRRNAIWVDHAPRLLSDKVLPSARLPRQCYERCRPLHAAALAVRACRPARSRSASRARSPRVVAHERDRRAWPPRTRDSRCGPFAPQRSRSAPFTRAVAAVARRPAGRRKRTLRARGAAPSSRPTVSRWPRSLADADEGGRAFRQRAPVELPGGRHAQPELVQHGRLDVDDLRLARRYEPRPGPEPSRKEVSSSFVFP